MLKVTIPPIELYDENREEFTSFKGQNLQLEHSLVSLSKWESEWNVPFLPKKDKTYEETISYIKHMTLTQNVKDEVYQFITPKIIEEVNAYINLPMTATTFISDNRPGNREVITAEIIYYWMITLNIPLECQKWHLNRLLTLINVCSIKNQPAKKMSASEIRERNRALNDARRKKYNTKG